MEAGDQISAGGLMDIVSGKQQRGKMLLRIFQEHNDRMKALIGKGYAIGTYKRFETSLKLTKLFIKWKYKAEDINIYALNIKFVNEFSFSMRETRFSESRKMKFFNAKGSG